MTTTPSTNRDRTKGGFTLVETLVAITVLVMAVAAPLTLGSQGLTASRVARDQVIATYLAQEAVEYIRNLRDNNELAGQSSWLTGLSLCLSGATCKIDIPQTEVTSCGGGTCPVLNFNSTTGLYGYTPTGGSWTATKFTRSIAMQETVPGIEAKITVTVSWSDGILTRTVRVSEYILNWQ